jgi:hypothetical protein
MCASCGCGVPNDTHGDSRNISMNEVIQAAQAAGIDPQQVAQNIMNASQQYLKQQSQPGQQGQGSSQGG